MPLDLNEKIQKRLMTELDTHQLTIQQTEDRGKTLVTLRRIEEGEVIMLPSFLLFTDKRTVVTFLWRDDNVKHADAVLQVQGSAQRSQDVFLLGIAWCCAVSQRLSRVRQEKCKLPDRH